MLKRSKSVLKPKTRQLMAGLRQHAHRDSTKYHRDKWAKTLKQQHSWEKANPEATKRLYKSTVAGRMKAIGRLSGTVR